MVSIISFYVKSNKYTVNAADMIGNCETYNRKCLCTVEFNNLLEDMTKIKEKIMSEPRLIDGQLNLMAIQWLEHICEDDAHRNSINCNENIFLRMNILGVLQLINKTQSNKTNTIYSADIDLEPRLTERLMRLLKQFIIK